MKGGGYYEKIEGVYLTKIGLVIIICVIFLIGMMVHYYGEIIELHNSRKNEYTKKE